MKKSSLSEFLRDARVGCGLTQKQAADHLGLSSSQYISNFERGLCEPALNHAISLCELYKVNLKELYDLMLDSYKDSLYKRIYSKAKRA